VNGVLLALSASALWGAADFLGGQLSRRLPLVTVLLVSQVAGAVAMGAVLGVRGAADAEALGWGVAAGLAAVGGLACVYRALAVGTMSIVAPVVATSAAVPVLVGLVSGERPGALALAGIVLAMVGVVLAGREAAATPPLRHRLSIGLALAAALLIGVQLVLLERAGAVDPLTGLTASRLTSAACFAVVALGLRRAVTARGGLPVVGLGLLDTGANLAFTLATGYGLLALVAVLSSLYPVVTVALAYGLLHERLRPAQVLGVALALAGVVLIVGS